MGDPGPFHRIVVGADSSASSARAVAWVSALAASTGWEVVLVHALTYDHELLRDLSLDTMRTWRRELANTLREQWAAPLVEAGARHRSAVVEGETVTEVLTRRAIEEGADLLVVGTSDRGGVVSRLTHHAQLPIVVIP